MCSSLTMLRTSCLHLYINVQRCQRTHQTDRVMCLPEMPVTVVMSCTDRTTTKSMLRGFIFRFALQHLAFCTSASQMCDIAVVQIILVAPCANRMAIKRMLQGNKMFHVRTAVIVAWARHVRTVHRRRRDETQCPHGTLS